MKVIGIVCLLLCGCAKKETLYDKYVKGLKNVNESSNVVYKVNVSYDYIYDGTIMYEIVIDEPITDMYNVKVLAIHNMETDDIFPSLGFFDDTVNMNVSRIDEARGYVKGIVLVGYISYEGNLEYLDLKIKLELIYDDIDGNSIKTYYVTGLDK